jgi:hypothetical protein
MKKVYIFIVLLGCFTATTAQKTIYQSALFKELSKDHKTIAILPFLATVNLNNTKDITKQKLQELEKKEGYAVQNALESYFLQRKERKKLSVEFQDIKTTNALLAKNNIDYSNIDIYTPNELSEILEVDAVIGGNLTISTLLSQGASKSFSLLEYLSGKTDYGRIAIKISDGKSGKLLWKYEKTINRKSGKNTNAIINAMMKKAARKFPYNKDKN